MALEYGLNLATTLEPRQVLELLHRKLGLEWNNEDRWLLGPGVIVSAIKQRDLAQQIIEEAFGFRPTIDVGFRLDKFEAQEQGMSTMLKATMLLLRQEQGDAVLLLNDETVILTRIAKELILNTGFGFWREERLAQVTLPFDVCDMPLHSL